VRTGEHDNDKQDVPIKLAILKRNAHILTYLSHLKTMMHVMVQNGDDEKIITDSGSYTWYDIFLSVIKPNGLQHLKCKLQ